MDREMEDESEYSQTMKNSFLRQKLRGGYCTSEFLCCNMSTCEDLQFFVWSDILLTDRYLLLCLKTI